MMISRALHLFDLSKSICSSRWIALKEQSSFLSVRHAA